MLPRPPLVQRLRPGHRLMLEVVAGAGYGLVAWTVFAAKVQRWPLAVAGTVLVVLAVAACQRRPLLAGAAALVTFWLSAAAPSLAFLAVPPMAYALYLVAARYRFRTALAVLAASLTGPAATALPDFTHLGAVVPFSLALVMAFAVGYARGEHRRYGDELLRHHAQQTEIARERARRGAAEERMRLARELHDVIAHSMSVITVQAGYGHLVIDEKPQQARDALAAIQTTGRQTLVEMRHLLGVLRQLEPGPATMTPTPGLDSLDDLVARTARAGVRVDLTILGRRRDLPAGIELSAYRIVQEALTNVVKHAGTGTARATIAYRPDALAVEIVDGGPGGPPAPDGLGLTGMRERVRLYGGHLDAGPLPGSGYRVAARLPAPSCDPASVAEPAA